MAKISYHINCGCGFTTDNLEEAKKHADNKRHKLDIFGSITPN